MRLLFLLFIVIPIMEIWVLLKVGSAIGVLSTLALIVLTAAIGVVLLRQQGLQTLLRARAKLAQNEIPAGELVEGLVLAVGGALLLAPGFITDTIGFCCLLPGVRQRLIVWGLGQVEATRKQQAARTDSHTIEGEYRREDKPHK